VIDWVTAVIPLDHSAIIHGGEFLSLTADGIVEYKTIKRAQLTGSHDNHIFLRTVDCDQSPHGAAVGGLVELHGNPVKFLQGHNVFGADDISGLVAETMLKCCKLLDIIPSSSNISSWFSGNFTLRRVDINYSWMLPDLGSVLSWIRSAEYSAHWKHRGRGELTKNGTLYFGKHSRRWGFKFYSKGHEIKAHPLPRAIAQTSLSAYADKLLRGELVIRSQELKRRNLSSATLWGDDTAIEIFNEMMSGLEMSETHTLDDALINDLPTGLRNTYLIWLTGRDMRQMLPARTFYRHRRALLQHGLDISVKQSRDSTLDNVVPLIRVLEAVPVGVPDWAIGTSLYFEPRKSA